MNSSRHEMLNLFVLFCLLLPFQALPLCCWLFTIYKPVAVHRSFHRYNQPTRSISVHRQAPRLQPISWSAATFHQSLLHIDHQTNSPLEVSSLAFLIIIPPLIGIEYYLFVRPAPGLYHSTKNGHARTFASKIPSMEET